MFKRLLLLTLGLGAGVALGVSAVRKVEAAGRRYRPDALAGSAAARAGGLRGRLAVAISEGRRAAETKESELRAVYRVDRAAATPGGSPAPSGQG